MNKITKGAIAGAAGIVLLLGGAGTFALWNDSADLDGSTVTSGELFITQSTAGSWSNVTQATPVAIPNITAFKMVPGNTLRFTKAVNITATGNDLTATLTYDPSSIVIPTDLAPYVTVTLGAVSSGSNIVSSGTNTFTVTPAVGASTVTVTVTVAFSSTTPGLTGQNQTIDLSNVTLTLTQVAP